MERDDSDRLLARAGVLPNGKVPRDAEAAAPTAARRYFQVLQAPARTLERQSIRRAPAGVRGSRVFAGGVNHDDLAGVEQPGQARDPGTPQLHPINFDFGSIIGSGSVFAQVPRAANDYTSVAPALKTLARWPLRAAVVPSTTRTGASVGRFEADSSIPQWRPEYPKPGVRHMRRGRRVLARGWWRSSPTRRSGDNRRDKGPLQRSRGRRIHRERTLIAAATVEEVADGTNRRCRATRRDGVFTFTTQPPSGRERLHRASEVRLCGDGYDKTRHGPRPGRGEAPTQSPRAHGAGIASFRA